MESYEQVDVVDRLAAIGTPHSSEWDQAITLDLATREILHLRYRLHQSQLYLRDAHSEITRRDWEQSADGTADFLAGIIAGVGGCILLWGLLTLVMGVL